MEGFSSASVQIGQKRWDEYYFKQLKLFIMETQKTWFITGASKGFGFEITKAALEAGDRVVATVRNNGSALYASLKDANLFVVEMDVTSELDVKGAVGKAI